MCLDQAFVQRCIYTLSFIKRVRAGPCRHILPDLCTYPLDLLIHVLMAVLSLGFPPDASIIFGIIPRFTPQSFVWERFIYTADIAVTPPVICMRA